MLILTPKIYNVLERQEVPSEDEIEDIMDDDEIRAVRVDGKRFKFKLHEKVKLGDPELLHDGASEFSLETKRYGGSPSSSPPRQTMAANSSSAKARGSSTRTGSPGIQRRTKSLPWARSW